jgi:dihydrofolate synthase/folylpolyglutamate synthase
VDFSASLDYLYGLQLFGIKLGLENMQALKARLALLQRPLPCVHVAGTNGKGSVSVLLAEILKHSGLRVGLYTSPHLHCFTERIRINGEPISQEEMVGLAKEIRHAANDIPVTFFEATTAMALLAFQKHKVDIAVVETGLGGRLDATNIVEPELCLITPVSYDHSEHLGDTLAEIAAEKAGIIKPGVPVVIGRQDEEAGDVLLQSAIECKATELLADRDYTWATKENKLSITVGEERINDLTCALQGEHQRENYAQAVAAAFMLRKNGWQIPTQAMRAAGLSARWPGRLEWLAERRVLLDVAHNLAGVNCLAGYLKEQELSGIHLVVGMSGQRDPGKVLKPLEKYAAAVYAVPVSFDQVVPTSVINSWAVSVGLSCREYRTAGEGLEDALQAAKSGQPVVVCGSLYMVAELRAQLLSNV